MLPFPPPGDLPNPGTEPVSLMSPILATRESLPLASLGRPIIIIPVAKNKKEKE